MRIVAITKRGVIDIRMLMFAIIRRKECPDTFMYECIYQKRKVKSGKKKI